MNDDRHSQLEMRWVSVTDDGGRTRMEAVWIIPTAPASIVHAA